MLADWLVYLGGELFLLVAYVVRGDLPVMSMRCFYPSVVVVECTSRRRRGAYKSWKKIVDKGVGILIERLIAFVLIQRTTMGAG